MESFLKVFGHSVLALTVACFLATGCTPEDHPEPETQRRSASGQAAGKATNVLIVTIDTLRADRLGSYGYREASTPHLDALAARGQRFSQATTVTPLTLPAHSSLFTGTYPAFHGVRDNGGFYLEDSQTTLAEILRQDGFRTGGFVGAFVLDSRWGIAQGFDRFFDDFDLTEFDEAPGMDAIQRPGSKVVDEALEWLQEDSSTPFLGWVHLYDPHTPYEAPEPYSSRFPATRSGAYDAEIAYTDHQVGRLMDGLEELGRLEDTLVVIAADHGEMLGAHGEVTHGFFIYDEAVHIPLILAGPGLEPAVVPEQVRIIDIFPTVLAQLGKEIPGTVQGVDLTPFSRGEGRRLVAHSESWTPRYHYGWSELQSIQDGRYKFIQAPQRELYDLLQDPLEATNLALADPARADAMEATLERLLDQVSATEEAAPQAVDPQTEAKLRALGYLGSASSRHRREEGPRSDPKDKIHLYNGIKEATTASALGAMKEAITKMEAVLQEDPEIIEGHLLLGNFHRKEDRLEEAAQAYRNTLALDPEHQEALYSLALTYKDLSRYGDARLGLESARRLDPRNGKVLWQLADLAMREGQYSVAEQELQSALSLDLDKPRFLLKLGDCYLEMAEPAKARSRLDEALAINPKLLTANYSRGLAFEAEGKPAQAILAYQAELALNDEAFRARFNLGKLWLKSGQGPRAVEAFRRTVEQEPKFGTGYLYLAKSLLDSGALGEVEQAARQGLANDPEPSVTPLGHLVLADLYYRQGRPAEAKREQAKAKRLPTGLKSAP